MASTWYHSYHSVIRLIICISTRFLSLRFEIMVNVRTDGGFYLLFIRMISIRLKSGFDSDVWAYEAIPPPLPPFQMSINSTLDNVVCGPMEVTKFCN